MHGLLPSLLEAQHGGSLEDLWEGEVGGLIYKVEDGEYAYELGPAFTAGANVIEVLRVWVCAPIAHYYCLDSFLFYQPLDLFLKVR